MIGWRITVYRHSPENYLLSLTRTSVLADWKVGSRGTVWLDQLVENGEAQLVKTGGYPNLYTALAGSIVPLFLGEAPPAEDDVPCRMPREITIKHAELALCQANEVLTITAWDQS